MDTVSLPGWIAPDQGVVVANHHSSTRSANVTNLWRAGRHVGIGAGRFSSAGRHAGTLERLGPVAGVPAGVTWTRMLWLEDG